MQHQKDRKRSRWDHPNQQIAWPPLQHPELQSGWGQGSGPWYTPHPPIPTLHPPPPHHPPPHHPPPHHPPPHHPPPHHPPPHHHHPPPHPHHLPIPPYPNYPGFDQFSAAYHSDRFDGRNYFQHPYQSPFWSGYGNTVQQPAYHQNGHHNFQGDGQPGNTMENGRTSVSFNGEESDNCNPTVNLDPLVCPGVQSSVTETVKDPGASHTGAKPQKDRTQKKAIDKDTSSKVAHSQNKKKKKEKKGSSHISPSKTLHPSGRGKSKLSNAHKKSPLKQRCRRGSGIQQKGCENSERFPLSVRRSPHNGNGLLSRATVPGDRGGQKGSGVSGKGAQNGIGYLGRSPMPVGRGRLNGRPPQPFGRGARNLFGRTAENYQRYGSQVYDDDKDDESNEIHHWLVNSKGEERKPDNDSVNKDPLPGSEEARTNAIKEAADRLKQALKTKKNVNLNKLLSSGEESKSDNQAQKVLKTCPKNLAQLELDASDMRAIGRANTEKTNCHAEDDSDDDIIEVQRPPSPVHQVIDLEPSKLFHGSSSSSDNNHSDDDDDDDVDDSDDDVPLGKRLGHVQNLSLDEHDLLSLSLGITSNPALDEDDVPLRTRLKHVQHLTCTDKTRQADSNTREEDNLPGPSSMEESERPTNSCNVNHCELIRHELSVSQKNSSKIMSPKIDSAHSIVNVESNDEISTHSPESSVQPQSTFSPRVACRGGRSPNKKRPSMHYPLSPAPNLDQRRRRSSSSSSLCESTTTPGAHTGLSNSPDSVDSTFKRNYDSKQRKIISDLKKINQSKLKDLVNNPRSGKLDFAMKQLMKEHRSILSKMSREVAERRIPAEYLNPKSTELPPDDSTLLADFAIDWSSLPGELISTLGDLFYDCNSETPMNICESQHNMTREPCDSPDIELLFPDKGSFPDRNDDQIGDDGLVLAPAISKDASNSVRIRVCQFAREELCLPSENDETCTLENNFEQSSPSTLPALINTETDLLVGEKQAQMGNSDLSRPNESRTNCKTREANSNQTNYPNPLCVTPRSLEDFDRPTREPLNMEVDGSVTETEPLQSIDNISVNSSSTGAVKAISNKIKPGKLKQKKKKKKAKQQMLLKKKKFVRLEERSWFVESVCSTKSNLSFKSKTKQITHSNPSPQNDDGTVQITETVSSENIADENSREHNGFMENVNQRNLPHDNPSCSIESSNIAAVQNQCVSMLPVLMMTVPANETSSEISNLTVPEMQKRIEEIDRMLQDLVQERCCLSQSLKAALAVDNCQNTAVMQSAQQSSGQDDVAQINVNEISVVPYHSAIENCGETSKRKCSSNDEDKTSQRVCHDDFESMQSIANSSLNVQGSISNVDCAENDGSVQPDQVKSNNSPRNHKNSQRKDSVTSYSSDVDFELEIDHFLNNPPFDYHCLKEVQGLIYHVKTCNSSIFAASENGLVYWIIDNEPRYLQGYFGEKTEVSVKSLEIIESCLYAVDYSGQLRIYDIPDLLPNCYLNPKPKHVFTLGITIFTTVFDWDRVYCGSSEGSVIPFNTKSFLVEEKLFDVGHPILSMTTKTDCGKRFLIVACRRHPTEIRDAESGLLIRSFGGSEWTVYTVISYDNLVYCGANKNKVLVFWFKDGKKCTELVAGTGIINMKLYNNYLVCGCHDGKIYVFNLRFHQLISTLSGPGGIIYTITFNRKKMLCSTQKKSLVCITATYPPEKPNSPEKDQDDVYVVSEQTEHKASEISNHEEGKVCTLSKDLSLGNYVCRNDLEGNILAIKIGGDSDLFAASSNGLVYWFRGRNWKEQVHTTFGKIRPNGSLGAVTCLEVVKSSLYTGSEDGILCIYSIPFKPGGTEIVEPTLTYNISNGIQCMEACWNFIYIGTKVGSVIPYSLDAKEVGEPLSSGDHPILCIKTHKEGPRRVLIVASRQQNIAIRDALSGLLLRSFGNCSSELTVYSVLCHNNLVYCGSNTNNILVYDFQSGEPKFKLDAGQGITAMKVFNDHLFCGCYDGKIYVFNLKTHIRVCSVNGPGNMILALDFMGKSMLCSSKGCLLTKYKHPLYTYFKDSIKMAK